MKCLAVCQDEAVIRTLHQVLVPSFELEFLVDSRPLARRLHDAGIEGTVGDLRRIDSYVKADVSPNTSVIVQDPGKRGLRRILAAVQGAGGHTRVRPGRRANMAARAGTTSCARNFRMSPTWKWRSCCRARS